MTIPRCWLAADGAETDQIEGREEVKWDLGFDLFWADKSGIYYKGTGIQTIGMG